MLDKPSNGWTQATICGPNASWLLALSAFGMAGLLFQSARPAKAFPLTKGVAPVAAPAANFVPLGDKEQKRVDDAIERGVVYLRRMQLPPGFFGDANPLGRKSSTRYPVAYAALPALALLQCGVP